MWLDTRRTYTPPPYRPKLFPRYVRWPVYAIGAAAIIIYFVGLAWLGAAFN